jgi:hypothetical protein
MEANSGSDEAMNVNYGKKLKQWTNEVFNAGKEIEAMKWLTLHRSLHRLIASIAQLCSGMMTKSEKQGFSGSSHYPTHLTTRWSFSW